MSILLNNAGEPIPTSDDVGLYFQCVLTRQDEGGDLLTTVGWIEQRGAHEGYEVELLEDGEFWKVVSVGAHGMSRGEIVEKQRKDRGSLPSLKASKKKPKSK